MKHILLAFSFLIMLVSCSSRVNLSNDEALTLLKENFKDDCVAYVWQETLSHSSNHKEILSAFRKLEKLGLVSIQKKQVQVRAGAYRVKTVTEFNWKPTQKGKSDYKKIGFASIVSQAHIVEIIGISVNEEAKTATVRFKYENKPTVFHPIRMNTSQCKKGIKEATVHFRLYDSGWNMENI